MTAAPLHLVSQWKEAILAAAFLDMWTNRHRKTSLDEFAHWVRMEDSMALSKSSIRFCTLFQTTSAAIQA